MKMEEIKFYRCMLCAKAVNQQDINSGKGCPKCGGLRVKPANLRFFEKIGQIIKHPKVWRWGEDAKDNS